MNLISEFTVFNLVILLSKVSQLTFFRSRSVGRCVETGRCMSLGVVFLVFLVAVEVQPTVQQFD